VVLDAQFNLTQAVLNQSAYEELLSAGKTVLACFEPQPSNDFFKVQKSHHDPIGVDEVSHGLRHIPPGDRARLDIVAGAFDMMKYSMIDDPIQLSHAASYFSHFISNARKEYDLIVFDCNPSSSFVTKCALENSTDVLSPVKPDKFSILGVGMVDRLFDHLGISLKHHIIVNGVKRSDPLSAVEIELRAHQKFGPKVLKGRLAQSKFLSADPSYTGFATDRGGPYSSVVRREIRSIADEVANRIGV
jgi:chromosome partitioning protein